MVGRERRKTASQRLGGERGKESETQQVKHGRRKKRIMEGLRKKGRNTASQGWGGERKKQQASSKIGRRQS